MLVVVRDSLPKIFQKFFTAQQDSSTALRDDTNASSRDLKNYWKKE